MRNNIQLCEYCNPVCPPRDPAPPEPDLDRFNPFSELFKPFDDVQINTLFEDPEALEYDKDAFDQLREDMFWQTVKDAYGETIVDAYGNRKYDLIRDPNFLEPPPIETVLDGLINKLPLTPEQRQELTNEKENLIADMGGAGSTDYSPEQLYDAICFRLPSFQLVINLSIFVPVFNLVASLAIAIHVFELFNKSVAGVQVLVEITTQIVIELLGPLASLCFSLAAMIPMPPFPSISLGANISLNLHVLQKSVNFSIFASLGLEAYMGLSPAEIAVLSGEAEGDFGSVGGSSKTPICEEGIKLSQDKQGSLTQIQDFTVTSKPISAKELGNFDIDVDTHINLVGPNQISVIKHSVSNMKVTPDSRPFLSGGIREAINRSKAQEAAVIFLFNKLNLPYDTKITLSELLLSAAKFDKKTPLDATILSLLSMNLPQEVVLNIGYVMMALGKTEPPCPILMLR